MSRPPQGDKADGREHPLDRVQLTAAELEHKDAIARQQRGRGRRDRPVSIETVRSAIERKGRIKHAYFGRQDGDVGASHIGRVRYDEIKWSPQRRPIIAGDKTRSVGEPKRDRIVASAVDCLAADIRVATAGAGQFR